MNCVTLQPGTRRGMIFSRGYVLFDMLTALLLFATVLMAGGWALIQSLAAGRAASLQTTAVDLAADLTESLLADPQDAGGFAQWQDTVRERLPAGSGDLLAADALSADPREITIHWRDHADAANTSLRLPVPPSSADPVR